MTALEVEINRLLLSEPVPLVRLRQIATEHGLQTTSIRRRAWPKLLGINRYTAADEWPILDDMNGKDCATSLPSRETRQQVSLDVPRSLLINERLDSEQHIGRNRGQRRRASRAWQARRRSLQLVLEAILGYHYGTTGLSHDGGKTKELCYYQGMHDVVGVVLLVVGTSNDKGALACACANTVVTAFLQDAAASSFDSVAACLGTIFPLVSGCAPAVGAALASSGVHPTVCLPWLITWFAHDAKDPLVVERLFDALICSHPALPLYLCAALILRQRSSVFAAHAEAPGDFAAMHCALAQMPKSDMLVGTEKSKKASHGGSSSGGGGSGRVARNGNGSVSVAEGGEDEVELWLQDARDLMQRVPPYQLPYLKGVTPEAKAALLASNPPRGLSATFTSLLSSFSSTTAASSSPIHELPVLFVQRKLPPCVAALSFESDAQLLERRRARRMNYTTSKGDGSSSSSANVRESKSLRRHRRRARSAGADINSTDSAGIMTPVTSFLKTIIARPATAIAVIALVAAFAVGHRGGRSGGDVTEGPFWRRVFYVL